MRESTHRVIRRAAWATALLLAAGALPAPAQVVTPVPQPCLAIADPLPSGVTGRPNVVFDTYPDYNWIHSADHLQGNPAMEKFAAGLLWNPPAPQELSGFQSVVVVTNPNAVPVSVNVEFYDEGGIHRGTVTVSVPAEGFKTVAASPLSAGVPAGRGSARIVSNTPGVPIVGETVHHTLSVNLGAYGGPVVTDPDAFSPGASSLQQLQARQNGKKTLYFAPIPISDQSPLDFLNGIAPLIWVQNPNNAVATVSIAVFSRLGINLGTTTVALPRYTTHLDLRLWNLLWGPYLSGSISYDDDFLVVATSDLPIVGDVVMTDLFGNGTGPGDNLRLGDRFRMGSAMMANTPAARVIDPELTYQPTNLGIQTILGISNGSTVNIGPVSIQYRDRNGAVLGTDNIASFPSGAVARIGPGLPASPQYPAGAVFDGWVRVTACRPGLLGWTMRTAGDEPDASPPPFKKVWGEALAGANGAEPGNGFTVTVGGSSWIRKVSPIVRVDPSWYWPGYTNFVNHASANVGPYWYRFYAMSGLDVSNPAGQPFAGVRFAHTSFSFEDPQVNPFLVFSATNLSGRVDRTTGQIQGIHAIGDPLVEWGIFTPVSPGEIHSDVADPIE
jgi:hypothetical protein